MSTYHPHFALNHDSFRSGRDEKRNVIYISGMISHLRWSSLWYFSDISLQSFTIRYTELHATENQTESALRRKQISDCICYTLLIFQLYVEPNHTDCLCCIVMNNSRNTQQHFLLCSVHFLSILFIILHSCAVEYFP